MRLRESLAFIQADIAFLFIIAISVTALSLPSYGQTPSQLSQAEQLLESGLTLMQAANFAEANTYIKKAANLYATSKKPVRAAHCYNHLSSNNRLMSKLNLAQQQAQKALTLLWGLQPGYITEKIRAYTNLGLISAVEANYDQSLRYLENASLLLHNPAVGSTLKIIVLGSLGYLNDDLGKYDQALFYYNKALGILKAQPNPSKYRLAKLYNNIGVAYVNKGLYKQARHYYRLELKTNLLVKGKDHPTVAGTYLNIGNSYFRDGDVGEALLYFKRSYRTVTATYGKNHAMTVLILNSMAKCEIKLRNYRQAVKYLNQAIAIKKRLVGAGHPELAVSYMSIGKTYSAMGKQDQTHKYFQKALSIRKQSLRNNHPKLAKAYYNLADYYLDIKQPKKAFPLLKQAEDILLASVGSRHPDLAATYAAMGRAYGQRGELAQSISHFQTALSITAPAFDGIKADENPEHLSVEYANKALSVLFYKARSLRRLHHETGDLSLLKASVLTYMALSKLLDHQQWGYNQLNSKLALGQRSHEIYEQAIQATYELYEQTQYAGYFQVIFYFSEKSKGRALLEAVAQTNDKKFADIPDTLLQYERQLQHWLSQVKQQLHKTFNSKKRSEISVGRLRDSLFALNRRLTVFEQNLERQFPKYHRLKYSSKFPSVYKIMQRLKENNSTILEYFYGQQSLFAIVITPDRIWVESLEYDHNLPTRIAKFTNALYKKRANFRNLGHQLYMRLIKPVEPYLASSNSIIIVPDGPLRLLAFDALLTDTPNSGSALNYQTFPYFIKNFNISYSTSIALNVVRTDENDSGFEKQFIGFAPGFSSVSNDIGLIAALRKKKWNTLPFSKLEIKRIAALFEEEDSFWDFIDWNEEKNFTLFFNEKATKATFKNNGSRNARYIHLATHAFVTNEADKRSGIVFSQNNNSANDNILYTNEIYNLRLHTQLVVLSACETGIGSIIKGEGIMGLSRAFQYAGANNLLVSLWKVGDRSTAALMVSFYKLLQKGYSLPQALSLAKRKMINKRRYAHPRYWASFKLIGSLH